MQSPMVVDLWQCFSDLNLMMHMALPMPLDQSTYVDPDEFEDMVYRFESLQMELMWTFHACYDDSKWPAYLHTGAHHMPLFFAFHLTLFGLNQGVLEAHHVITREQHKHSFSKGDPAGILKCELRRLFFALYDTLPAVVREACETFADLGHDLRAANKRKTDSEAKVSILLWMLPFDHLTTRNLLAAECSPEGGRA
jgi:hypothetical protein